MQLPMTPDNPYWDRALADMSEDCLYLNVWTPASSASEKLPVLVWIHGGGLIWGAGTEPIYDGSAIARKGVVVVSLNYRLNVFGWFAHPELTRESEHHSSGNYGSLDQLAAIRWVKNNISHFGGDPNRITLWGESGGSRAINFLTASPLLKGLAAGAIAESHTVFGRMATLADAEANGVQFCKALGKLSIAELRAMPAEELLRAHAAHPLCLNIAVVDGWFLPEDVHTIYAQGKQNDIPLLTGATNDEGGTVAGSAIPGEGGFSHVHPTAALWGGRVLVAWSKAVLFEQGTAPQVQIEEFEIDSAP